ncbi:MAG: hypothetical protein IIW52_08085, partial [Alistipes sp.]|nr:hypothetical protein [Alistipes sp.]
IPLKQNYRTNILGALLTKETEIKVEILPGFGTPDEVVDIWDGKTVTEPAYDPATETYTVKNGAELAWIAQTVSGVTRATQADLVGKTIVLSKDIELGGNEWLPIGHPVGGSSYTNAFKGTFDGQGHSVMNFVVNNSKCAGLFGCLVGATVKNVTVSNAKITSNHYAGAIAGWAESGATLNNIINCHVKNSQITISAEQLANGNWDNGDKAGAIAGFWYFGSIEGCTATDVTVKAYRDLGGIVGIAQGGAVVSNNEIKNVTLIQDNSHNYKNYTKAEELNVNSFVGRKAANDNGVLPTIENNKGLAEIVIDLEGLATTPMEMIQNTPGATVTLPAQEEPYVLPQTIADGVTIVGEGADTKVNISKGYGQSVASAKNVTFKNLTINKDNTLYVGFHHVQTETYIGCVINGSLWTYGNAYFEDCTFNQTGNEYGLRIYGKGDVEINDCTFNCAGKAVLIYSEGAGEYNVDVNDCTFNSSVKKDDKSAIQMHTEKGIYGTLKITNTTATGFADINNGLWNEVINSNDNIYSATEGTLTNNFEKWVDGVQVYNEYSIVDGIYEVYTVAGLQTVLDKATKDTNIKFVNDLNGDVKVTERDHKGIDFVIDGNGKKYDGQIKIQGNSDEGDETLLIKNINFETSTKSREFIWSADSSNGSMWRYANNVTIKDCTFTAVEGSEAVHTAVGVKFQQAYDITLEKCTATNLHSLLQAESCGTTITVDGATVVNGKNAISLNNTMNAIVKNSSIESVIKGGYGIRHKGEVENYKLSVENCTVKAFVPVLIRNMTASSYTCTLSGTNNLIETNEDHDWQIVICNGDYDGKNEPVAPTGNCTLTGAESFNVFK